MNRHVVIVGGGLSGSLVLLALARAGQTDMSVTLLEQTPRRMGRGVAYQAEYRDRTLNVRAGQMSVYADRPDHFVEYLKTLSPWRDGGSQALASTFAPRGVFGDYLEHEVRRAAARSGLRLSLETATVTDLAPADGRYRVIAEDGREWRADEVVLAPGNCPPAPPCPLSDGVESHSRYVANPWRQDVFGELDPNANVLLVGAGLTAVDHLLTLSERGHRGRIDIVSRRGWWPGTHREPASHALPDALLRIAARTPRGLLRFLRHRAATVDAPAWPDLIDAIRPHVNSIWQQWDSSARKVFLRHLRHIWDIHRHRIPAEHRAVLDGMETRGQLHRHAGRLRGISTTRDGGLMVEIAPRSGRGQSVFKPDLIVNCTGPEARWRNLGGSVVARVVERGLALPDEFGFGLQTDPNGRSLDATGAAVPGLFLLGPVRRGQLWETSALHEIRTQAGLVASDISSRHHLERKLSRVA